MLKLIILPRQARDKHSLGKALKKEMRCLQAASRGRRRQRPRTGLLPSFRAGLGGKASTDNARGNIHVPYTLPVKKQTVVAAGGRRRWVVSLLAVMVALGLLIGGAAARCATHPDCGAIFFHLEPNLLFCQDTLGTNATKPVFKRRIVQAAEFARRSVATCHIGFEVAGARRRQVEKHCGEESQGASIERSTGRGCAVINF